jgi:hypothetical protein
MKATFSAMGGRVSFEMEGESPKALFKKLALVQEIFDADQNCGCCASENIKFRARQVDDFEFFELGCADCFARLQFGQHKKGGGLFPKRRDDDGNYLDNRGWAKYEKKGAREPEPTGKDRQRDEVDDSDVPF